MDRRTFVGAGLATGASFAILSRRARAQTEVRYGLWAKEGEAQFDGAMTFKEVVEERTDGRFEVKIFPGNQLGTPREMLAQLALDDTQLCASGDPGIKEIEYLALPYLMKGIENYAAVIDSPIGEQWNEKLVNERRIRLLGFLPRSPRQISTNKPIHEMADLRGLKIRAPERDYYVESLTALGANPTPMAFAEVYTALQTGVVDGQENPIETIWAQKFHEVQEAIAMVSYIDKPAYVMIGQPFWSRLSEEERAVFQDAQVASRTVVEEILPRQQEELIEKMKAEGIVFTYPDQEEFIEATQPVRDKLGIAVWGEELYRQIVEIGQQDLA